MVKWIFLNELACIKRIVAFKILNSHIDFKCHKCDKNYLKVITEYSGYKVQIKIPFIQNKLALNFKYGTQ